MLAPQLGHKKGKTQACPDPHAEAESAKDHECADDEGPKPTGREMGVPAGTLTLRQASLVSFHAAGDSRRQAHRWICWDPTGCLKEYLVLVI